jgi:macrolide-specific efflux system membrane fusion protein
MDAYFTTLGGGERRWTGQLRQVLPTPEVLNNVVLYTALFDVENPGGELMTQMTAQVYFVVEAAYDALRVPVAAVRYAPRGDRRGVRLGGEAEPGTVRAAPQPQLGENGGPGRAATVMVVGANGTPAEREIRVGASDRIYTEVLSGLEEGEEVVVFASARGDDDNDNGGNDRWQRRFGAPMGGLP